MPADGDHGRVAGPVAALTTEPGGMPACGRRTPGGVVRNLGGWCGTCGTGKRSDQGLYAELFSRKWPLSWGYMRNLPCGALNSLHCPLPLDPRKFNFFWGEKESSAHNPSSGGVSPFWVPHIIPGQALFGFRKFRKFRTPSPPAPQPPGLPNRASPPFWPSPAGQTCRTDSRTAHQTAPDGPRRPQTALWPLLVPHKPQNAVQRPWGALGRQTLTPTPHRPAMRGPAVA